MSSRINRMANATGEHAAGSNGGLSSLAASSEAPLAKRMLRGNGHVIGAGALLLIFGGTMLSISEETTTARVVGQAGTTGLRSITVEFEHEGDRYVASALGDFETSEGSEVRIFFDGDDPSYVEFSRLDLFMGFYIINTGLLIYLIIALVFRFRRR